MSQDVSNVNVTGTQHLIRKVERDAGLAAHGMPSAACAAQHHALAQPGSAAQ